MEVAGGGSLGDAVPHYDGFQQGYIFGFDGSLHIGAEVSEDFEREAGCGHEGSEVFGGYFDYEDIADIDYLVAGGRAVAYAPVEQPDYRHILAYGVLEVSDEAAGEAGAFDYADFDEVVGDVDGVGEACLRSPGRDETPADGADEEHTAEGDNRAYGGEVEHAEGFAGGFLAKGGDDDVRGRSDEGAHAAEQGGEGQGH